MFNSKVYAIRQSGNEFRNVLNTVLAILVTQPPNELFWDDVFANIAKLLRGEYRPDRGYLLYTISSKEPLFSCNKQLV